MKLTKFALAAMLMVSVSAPALAKDPTDGKSEDIAVEKMICQQLYVHKPSDDVAFKPGVDVNGKEVAPADLAPPSTFVANTADYIEVPLTVDLAQKLSQPVPEGVKMEGVIGNLRLYKDGRITYNGQDVLTQADTMCGGTLKVDEKAALEVEPAPGSASVQPVQAAASGATAPSSTSNPPPPKALGEEDDMPLAKQSANFLVKPDFRKQNSSK